MPAGKKASFSFSDFLSGYLEALFGAKFGFYLSSLERSGKHRASFAQKKFTFEQQKVINLLQIIEDAFTGGKMENVKKYALVMVALLKDLYNTRRIPAGFRQKFFSGILYKLFVQLGDYLLSHGLAVEALIFYQELLNHFPRDTFLIKKAARAFYLRGPFFWPQAEQLYRQILEQSPQDLEAYEALGRLLENIPGRENEAFLIYREALRHCRTDMAKIRFYLYLLSLSPDDYNLLLRLGRLFLRQGIFIESRYYLEEAFKRQQNPWTALDLGRVCLLLNELGRAREVAAALYGKENLCPSGYYLYGLINEFEEDWEKARQNYLNVPPDAELYWEARAGAARVLLNEGKYPEALELAQQLLSSLPAEQKSVFEKEYLELCKSMEDNAPGNFYYSTWRENLRESEPYYELKKDIYKRNMGAAFWRKYEFQEVFGAGPSGEVFLGRERNTGGRVVIKQLDVQFSSNPVVIRRIQGLLKTLRRLSSLYIVKVFEDCYFNNRFFFAMEYMEGDSLAKFIRLRTPLPLTEAFSIAFKVCSALDYLYSSNGTYHGNLKPQNILFSAEGNVKIGDFDMLWLLEGARVFSGDIFKKYASFKETFLYAAPERFSDKSLLLRRKSQSRSNSLEAAVHGGVDHRADLYSLGVILFELLTGFLPFKKNSIQAIVRFHRGCKTWPSPRLFNPALPPEVEEIVLRLLNRNPDSRYATPAELKEAIKKAKIF